MYRFFVHIADVSHYVQDKTQLDSEARLRATSVYLADRVIPMLPPKLSNGLCSLNPHVDRLSMTAEMIINRSNGEIIDGHIYESVINSDRRMSYNECYRILFENEKIEEQPEIVDMLWLMKDLTEVQKVKVLLASALFGNPDVLLLDDIQFMADKVKTQEVFFTIFNKMRDAGKHIVITSDRQPQELKGIENRLVTRFSQGLAVKIGDPDQPTCIDILRKKIEANDNDSVSFDENVLYFFAEKFSTNIRELEGAFNRVCAYAEINSLPITIDLTKKILKCNEDGNKVTMNNIAEVISDYYNIKTEDLIGSARGQKVTTARHMAVYLTKEILDESFVKIANFYNKKHPTIIFAYDKIKKDIANDKKTAEIAREIKQALKVL